MTRLRNFFVFFTPRIGHPIKDHWQVHWIPTIFFKTKRKPLIFKKKLNFETSTRITISWFVKKTQTPMYFSPNLGKLSLLFFSYKLTKVPYKTLCHIPYLPSLNFSKLLATISFPISSKHLLQKNHLLPYCHQENKSWYLFFIFGNWVVYCQLLCIRQI